MSMVPVCPQCGSIYTEEPGVHGERVAKCEYCSWTGSSVDLIAVDAAQVKDPRVFDFLADWLRDELGGTLTTGLYLNGLVPPNVRAAAEANNIQVVAVYMSKIIRTFVAGIVQGVMNPDALEAKGQPVADSVFLKWFSTNVEVPLIRAMIELGIVKKSQDPKNIRYVTKLVRFAVRKMWGALMEELREHPGTD